MRNSHTCGGVAKPSSNQQRRTPVSMLAAETASKSTSWRHTAMTPIWHPRRTTFLTSNGERGSIIRGLSRPLAAIDGHIACRPRRCSCRGSCYNGSHSCEEGGGDECRLTTLSLRVPFNGAPHSTHCFGRNKKYCFQRRTQNPSPHPPPPHPPANTHDNPESAPLPPPSHETSPPS